MVVSDSTCLDLDLDLFDDFAFALVVLLLMGREAKFTSRLIMSGATRIDRINGTRLNGILGPSRKSAITDVT